MNLYNRILNFLEERRNRVLSGQINCIPLPFHRFRREFPGIEQGVYYLVSGATKASKTQLTNYLFVYNTIMYMFYNPGKIQAKIFYYALEETAEAVTLRFMAFLLHHLDNTITISPTDLKSTDETKPLPENVLKAMKSEKFAQIMHLYEEIITFYDSKNPTGIWKDFTLYAKENGTTHYKPIEMKDDFGKPVTRNMFDYYTPNNPDEYVFIIVDHVSLLDSERGKDGRSMSLKETIDKLSEYMVIARNRYKYIPVLVQQQSTETSNLEAFKNDKIRPTKAGLADSKYTGNDCSCMIGITNPASFDKADYLGYNITILKDKFRLMEVVLNRNGRANGLCPLLFDGAINNYTELPRADDKNAMQRVYEQITNKNNYKISMFISKINKIFNK
jgi:hypothetical protein